jgi:glyoxylase-like metal-dependent hydrolase (beta-lactamase superfamily II)
MRTKTDAAVKCHVFSTGYCLASEHHVLQGGRRTPIRCHALVALLEHPTKGRLLFDTGYSHRRLTDATRALPYRFYRRAAPFFTTPGESASAILSQRFGIDPEEIGTVIVSHFHPDHLSGLGDFPGARLIASGDGYREAAKLHGLRALAKGVLPDLIPPDFAARADLLPTKFTGEPLPHLGPTYDLFGDGLLRVLRLPGHARGQIGVLVQTERGPVLLIADAAYTRRSVRENRPPHPITNLFTEGARTVGETLLRLHRFAHERPEVRIIPTHCPEAYGECTDEALKR